jgi:hypothetical protein
MYCAECGNEVKDGSKFCGKCGAPAQWELLDRNQAEEQNPSASVISEVVYVTEAVEVPNIAESINIAEDVNITESVNAAECINATESSAESAAAEDINTAEATNPNAVSNAAKDRVLYKIVSIDRNEVRVETAHGSKFPIALEDVSVNAKVGDELIRDSNDSYVLPGEEVIEEDNSSAEPEIIKSAYSMQEKTEIEKPKTDKEPTDVTYSDTDSEVREGPGCFRIVSIILGIAFVVGGIAFMASGAEGSKGGLILIAIGLFNIFNTRWVIY